jgi:hypothetical protein
LVEEYEEDEVEPEAGPPEHERWRGGTVVVEDGDGRLTLCGLLSHPKILNYGM